MTRQVATAPTPTPPSRPFPEPAGRGSDPFPCFFDGRCFTGESTLERHAPMGRAEDEDAILEDDAGERW